MAAALAAAPPPETATLAEALVVLVRDVSAMGEFAGAPRALREDCVRLVRKVSLLSHLLEEIQDSANNAGVARAAASSSSSSRAVSPGSCLADLLLALEAVERFLQLVCGSGSDLGGKNIALQLQYVTWQLEEVLRNLPYDYFGISDEVQEEVELVLSQLRRATAKIGAPNIKVFSEIYRVLSHAHGKEYKHLSPSLSGCFQIDNISHHYHDFQDIVVLVAQVNIKSKCDADQMQCNVVESPKTARPSGSCRAVETDTISILEAKMKEDTCSDSIAIPEDFRCPITLELMRDPVIVSTGQTYERSSIQRWIDCGNQTCPKTQQKLQNLTLTPNYVLRSLIMQWSETHNVERPCRTSGKLRKCDGSFKEVSEDRTIIDALVHKLSSSSKKEQKSALAEIRSLAKRNSGNRILIAEAGAIPTLVDLLSDSDLKVQEHAVTSILNLSIYDENKEIIMLAGAIDPIIQVLRTGSMEARENAAAAIFSLSVIDESKITIGSIPGAIEALVELLNFGSSRGKKDAATALFNLCIYQGNKPRAIRAGILTPLLKMLKDSSSYCMVDEVLTILSVLVSHREGKVAIAKACVIPLLIDLLRTGQPRSKENAAAILLALCKKDGENLACVGRLGAFIPLTELARSGTDRAKRKASSLLEHLKKLHTL
ncbi:putative U box domain, armadillo-like helical, Zinc finger, RING/FYVE/PHD-type [Dioscorea sansibarensis]